MILIPHSHFQSIWPFIQSILYLIFKKLFNLHIQTCRWKITVTLACGSVTLTWDNDVSKLFFSLRMYLIQKIIRCFCVAQFFEINEFLKEVYESDDEFRCTCFLPLQITTCPFKSYQFYLPSFSFLSIYYDATAFVCDKKGFEVPLSSINVLI